MRLELSPALLPILEKARQAGLAPRSGSCSAPSNIALIKYWGKEPDAFQIPLNSSLSMTLGGFRSFVTLRSIEQSEHLFSLNDVMVPLPARLQTVLDFLLPSLGYPGGLSITGSGNFPIACGLASSASGGAALIGALSDAFRLQEVLSPEEHLLWLTEGARLFSGSATRSVLPAPFVLWERLAGQKATRTRAVPTGFPPLGHGVVLMEAGKKPFSSSRGHEAAPTSPLFLWHQATVPQALQEVQKALLSGDWQTLAQHTEQEAFALHAIMQTAHPPLQCLPEKTQTFLNAFLSERHRHALRAMISLDAGPNVHLLFLEEDKSALESLLEIIAKAQKMSFSVLWNNASAPIALGKDQVDSLPKALLLQKHFSGS
ncbi:MAG: hypothetical protein LBJ70_03410 [Holosporales bacterium]|jgi:diphosphomevalonate decarboxylase|nr:hypothetical protein [Holosporales bacterium]